jgi:hypothetical protein
MKTRKTRKTTIMITATVRPMINPVDQLVLWPRTLLEPVVAPEVGEKRIDDWLDSLDVCDVSICI